MWECVCLCELCALVLNLLVSFRLSDSFSHSLEYFTIFFISGPRFDWDPEIVAALDEDFDFEDPENQLDDDFITKANAPGGADDEEMTADVKDDDLDDDFIIKAGGFTERTKQRVNW